MKAMLGFMYNEQQASFGRQFSCANNGIVASAGVGIAFKRLFGMSER